MLENILTINYIGRIFTKTVRESLLTISSISHKNRGNYMKIIKGKRLLASFITLCTQNLSCHLMLQKIVENCLETLNSYWEMCFLWACNGLTMYPIQCVCACIDSCKSGCVLACVCVCRSGRVIECEYWLGGIVLSRGHLSPAGPLALQLFRMCHRSVSQTGTQTHTYIHTQTVFQWWLRLKIQVWH